MNIFLKIGYDKTKIIIYIRNFFLVIIKTIFLIFLNESRTSETMKAVWWAHKI